MTVNGKVRKFVGPKDGEPFKMAVFIRGLNVHSELGISANLYDPKYGAPTKLEEFTREHAAYIEDFVLQNVKESKQMDLWEVAGTFDQRYAD